MFFYESSLIQFVAGELRFELDGESFTPAVATHPNSFN